MRTAICFFIILFLVSCGTSYTEEDFYDTVWENVDSAKVTTIELHSDGTFDANNFYWSILYPPEWNIAYPPEWNRTIDKNTHLNSFRGTWHIDYNSNGFQYIEFCVENDSFQFDVCNIYNLRYAVGDPDARDFYFLRRTNVSTDEERKRMFLDWFATF